jgi:lipid II:glycine glycyltransferase (peptidoglycan interpeptide bridge formation enzyme)
VAGRTDTHILQTSPWGALKSQFGWTVERVCLADQGRIEAGAQVLYRRIPAGLGCLAYVPRGPLVAWEDPGQVSALLLRIRQAARDRGAVALMIEPQLPDGPEYRRQMQDLGFQPAPVTIQPPRTVIVDLSPDEEQILKAMKSKTRYNVRLAGRRGVTVQEATSSDLPAFNGLMRVTGSRDEFAVHAPEYYEAAFRLFVPRGWARLLLAEVAGDVVAGIMVFAVPPTAWYLYGASADTHRQKMPTYLLQWHAIRWAKSLGCTSYDLWGVPDEDEETLEAEFTRRSDDLWGVYRFKRGFGGRLVRTVGCWDLVYAPLRYRLYTSALAWLNRRQAT